MNIAKKMSKKCLMYNDVLINVLRFRNFDQSHEIHEMIKIENKKFSKIMFFRRYQNRHVYDIFIVLRNSHIISINNENLFLFYINNYIN